MARVTLDTTRVGRDASRIADEVVAHLSGLVGANVKVMLKISMSRTIRQLVRSSLAGSR